MGGKKGEEQKHLFELICQLKFLLSSRSQRLLECNLLSPDMKYFNVNYRKERQHFDTLESVKKCAQFAHVRNMQEKISQLNNAHMRSQSTLSNCIHLLEN